jgi:hypothetical protein
VLALKGDRSTGAASALSGMIIEAINLLLFTRQDVAYRRVDKYHEELLQSNTRTCAKPLATPWMSYPQRSITWPSRRERKP